MNRTDHEAISWRKAHPLLSEVDFAKFHALILERTGLMFDHKRRDMLTQALAQGAYQAGSPDLDRYFDRLTAQPTHSGVWESLISALTVNETYFFRDAQQIDVLRRRLLPELITRRQSHRRLRLWSAGCSTGEEPYTLAILLHQLLPELAQWDVLIMATDIDRQSLRQAECACYREWSFRDTDSVIRQLYFTPNGEHLELRPHLRRLVRFSYLNLAEDVDPSPVSSFHDVDLILCRNVAIYLPESVIRTIAQRFYQCLTSYGWLMVGASETSDQRYRPFEAVNLQGITVYRKMPETLTATVSSITPAPHSHFLPEEAKVFCLSDQKGQCTAPEGSAPFKVSPPCISIATVTESQTAPPSAAILYREGEEFLRQRRLAEARRCFAACLDQQPNHVAACRRMARLDANAGCLAEARRWAEKALQQEPMASEAHYLLALILEEQGEIESAAAQFRKVIYLDPEFILAHVHLSDLYQKLAQTAAAARHRARAHRLLDQAPVDRILPGADDLTVRQMRTLLQHIAGAGG